MPTVYVTAPPEAGARLAQSIIEARLAACVNRVTCTSTYRWDGDIVDDEEEILLIKTTDERYDELVSHVTEHHPYDVPCIERFEEEAVPASFEEWRASATTDESP